MITFSTRFYKKDSINSTWYYTSIPLLTSHLSVHKSTKKFEQKYVEFECT